MTSSDSELPVALDEIDGILSNANHHAQVEGTGFSEQDAKTKWRSERRAMPPPAAKLLDSIQVTSLKVEALHRIESQLFGWDSRRVKNRTLDQADVRRAWREAWRPELLTASLKTVRSAIDEVKSLAQIQLLQDHPPAEVLPSWQREPKVTDSVLRVRDVQRGKPTFGVRSYLEPTPVEVVVHVVRRWMRMTRKTRPSVWDPTAGSGTVADVVTTIFGGSVASTDLAVENAVVAFGDLENIGTHHLHRRQHLGRTVIRWYSPPQKGVIATPDLVFLHPPSRGFPGASFLFGSRAGEEITNYLDSDLTYADRRRWVEVVSNAVRAAIGRLGDGGLLSLLVPEYVRCHQEVADDEGLADGVLARFGTEEVQLVQRWNVIDERPVNQISIGSTRGPLVHLLLRRGPRS